ncbi:hypothetical protein V5O48_009378 [Marasmius crinis-equi]|uniref:F-box domain-containing protein n=1 Tax=Marasmius crinis-equi TaxID=585013 RepID=A0ABR3FBA6_9AGAR
MDLIPLFYASASSESITSSFLFVLIINNSAKNSVELDIKRNEARTTKNTRVVIGESVQQHPLNNNEDFNIIRQPDSSTPAVSTVEVPQDLLYHIFNELDDESVCQCALAARSFLTPAQNRLFRTVVLKEADMSGRSSRLSFLNRPTKAQLLAASLALSPELGKLVKELICEGEGLPHVINRSRPSRAWYCEAKVPFNTILPHLSGLQSLSLLFCQENPLLCVSIPSPSRVAILQALQSPKIRKLAIENVVENVVYDANHDLLFLRHAVAGGGLEELSITTFDEERELSWLEHWWDVVPIPICTKVNPNVLRTLRINGPPTVVERVLKWVHRPPHNSALLQEPADPLLISVIWASHPAKNPSSSALPLSPTPPPTLTR